MVGPTCTILPRLAYIGLNKGSVIRDWPKGRNRNGLAHGIAEVAVAVLCMWRHLAFLDISVLYTLILALLQACYSAHAHGM